MYPFKFKSIYKELVWGGNQLQLLFNRNLPSDKVGESWDICTHKNGTSVVANGNLAGKTLQELLEIYPAQIVGTKASKSGRFPLLIKWIDANDKLSIQVHPADDYAYRVEGEPGKTEAWYIMTAKDNARIVYGLAENMSRERFTAAIDAGNVGDTLRYVPVKTGDMIFVPAGLVHALLEGVVVCEVQQNSDTTYRVYDYDRIDTAGKSRELHINKALDVIDFKTQPSTDFSKRKIECKYFSMEEIELNGRQQERTAGQFIAYCVISGRGGISYRDLREELYLGDSVLVPACLEEIVLEGDGLRLLKIR